MCRIVLNSGPPVRKSWKEYPKPRRKKEILDIPPRKAGEKIQNPAARRKSWTSRQEKLERRSKTPPQERNFGHSAAELRKNVQKASEEARKWTYRHEKAG